MHYSRCVTVIQGCPEASQDSPPRDPVPDAQVQREAAPGPRIHPRGAQVRRRQQEDGADHRHLRRPAQVTTVGRIRISLRPMFINISLQEEQVRRVPPGERAAAEGVQVEADPLPHPLQEAEEGRLHRRGVQEGHSARGPHHATQEGESGVTLCWFRGLG